jgi:transposase
MPLTSEQRMRAVIWSEEGISHREISRRLNCSHSTISRFLQNYAATNSIHRQPGSGRPPATSSSQDDTLINLSLRHRLRSSRQLRNDMENRGVAVSTSTVQRRLRAAGILSRIAVPRPLLGQPQREARLEFAIQHQLWTNAHFANVLFTDEAPFYVGSTGGRVWVHLRQGERPPEAQTMPRLRRPGPRIMVWGAIRRSGVGPLVRVNGNLTANRYLEILNEVIPQIQRNHNFVWMHDNAPAHRARIVQQYFAEHRIRLLPWPPYSPDLNPIENVWGYITQNVSRSHVSTPDQLWRRVQQFWAAISAEQCRHYIDSMPTRLEQVRLRKGGNTDY